MKLNLHKELNLEWLSTLNLHLNLFVFHQELIQNADDAGATEVKFLYDSRENAYGTSSLITPELSKYQGPALYVHNNGLFKEQDWKGIEGIMQGNKRRDPVTAGRFGIGFNSVYHITGTLKPKTLRAVISNLDGRQLTLIGCGIFPVD